MSLLTTISLFIAASAGAGFAQPEVIRFGATTAEMQKALAPLCPKLHTRKIDPPFLDDVKTEQLQIDCDGFEFRGRARHVEFVIRDDRLVMVWLMVDANEGPAIIRDMIQAYGQPTGRNDRYVAFEGSRAAWRHKPAEILFYGTEVAKALESDFR
jgi:hypothetical protein